MKKIFVGLIVLFLTCIAFAEAPAKRTANSVVIDGTVNGKKAKDNFRIINKSNVSSYLISIYGFNSKTGVWDFAGNCLVKKQNETYAIDSKINLRNYTYFSVESEEIQNFNYSLNIKHDDLYITINDGESTGKAPNYTQYQKVIQMSNFSKDQLYEGILQACVKIFNNASAVIQYKDKESGVISGRALSSFSNIYFVFNIEAREGRYRITFNIENQSYTYTEIDCYNRVVPDFERIINNINEYITSSYSSSDDDW